MSNAALHELVRPYRTQFNSPSFSAANGTGPHAVVNYLETHTKSIFKRVLYLTEGIPISVLVEGIVKNNFYSFFLCVKDGVESGGRTSIRMIRRLRITTIHSYAPGARTF